jgi:uncharacterized protein (DUF433 family)
VGISAANNGEPWRARLTIPNYQIKEAARYVRLSSQTVTNWHAADIGESFLSRRDPRSALSYMQLIEVAVVAAFREAGVKLNRVREARDYIMNHLKTDYPFADYRFKTDGKRLLIDYAGVDSKSGKGKLLELNKSGQLAWDAILKERLKEFSYDESQRIVLRWQVAGPKSPIIIDPRLSFGAPTVKGTPTWAIKGRWIAGEQIDEIADDFGLKEELVAQALEFEGVNVGPSRAWAN